MKLIAGMVISVLIFSILVIGIQPLVIIFSVIVIYIYIYTHIHTVVIVHYLPYLLLNPNPESPYNDVAAELYRRDKKGYQQKVEGECGVYCFVFQLVELLF
jgi:hypothetical protein